MLWLHDLPYLQGMNLIKPVASVKKLSMTLNLAMDLPVHAVGDEKRLLQTILNIVGNAIKFTKEGYVSIEASFAKPEYSRYLGTREFCMLPSEHHFYLLVQVGCLNFFKIFLIISTISTIRNTLTRCKRKETLVCF